MSYKIGIEEMMKKATCPGLVEMEEQVTYLQQIICELLRENETLLRLTHHPVRPFRRDYVEFFMWLRQEDA